MNGLITEVSTGDIVEQSVNEPVSRKKKGLNRQRVQLSFDVPFLLVVITLLIFGLVMVYSASYDYSNRFYGDPTTIFYRQLLWLVIGLSIAITLAFLDYHRWQQIAVVLMGITIIGLIAVLFLNEVRNGAVRTLFGGSIQPSELAKLVTVIYLAVWLSARREKLSDVSFGLIPLAIILGLLGGLVIIQPDFSAVATIFLLGGLMFFLAGGDLKQIGILMVIALVIGLGIVLLAPTGAARIELFIAGIQDPTQGSYHVRRSLEAIIKGGWFGVGIGEADTKLTGLPVPPTDSIFAVVGEEMGVIGSIVLVGLFALFLWRGFKIVRQAPDQLGMLLAAGLTLWISIEAFINMSVMVNLLPFAGNALPLISAGGSSLVVTLAAIGILINISRLSEKKKSEKGKLFNAVIDLRRRNRRRRVSGSRRVASRDR
ncbi:MAG: putative peptidoglycan glycosyltransferase FtsW [Anaerolineales bacterium]